MDDSDQRYLYLCVSLNQIAADEADGLAKGFQ